MDERNCSEHSHGSGTLDYHTRFFIAGGNRAGRPPEVRTQILNRLMENFCEIANVDRAEVRGHISETPASWTMEAGEILPEPGQEPAKWYRQEAVSR